MGNHGQGKIFELRMLTLIDTYTDDAIPNAAI